jgi:hypothetical protein
VAEPGRRLVYLYMGSADVGRDVDFYQGELGGNELGLLERVRPGVLESRQVRGE